MREYFTTIILCIGLFATSIGHSMDPKQPLQSMSDEGRMLYQATEDIGQLIGQKYRMSPCGVGGGVNNGVWLMSISFDRYDIELSQEEARRLIVKCVNEILERVNTDTKLRPYLKIYPFKAKNLNIVIINHHANGHDVFFPSIGMMSCYEGKMGYFTYDETEICRYKSEKYETYDEAVAILAGEKQKLAADAKPIP